MHGATMRIRRKKLTLKIRFVTVLSKGNCNLWEVTLNPDDHFVKESVTHTAFEYKDNVTCMTLINIS